MSQLFGEKLRVLRHQSEMTQVELAQHLLLASYTHITKLEANQDAPSLELVVRVAYLFNVSADYLLRDNISLEDNKSFPSNELLVDQSLHQQFGPKLRALRLAQGWGQTELAHRLNLARRGYVSNLEAGRKMPSLELVIRIADLFEVTIDYLVRDEIPR